MLGTGVRCLTIIRQCWPFQSLKTGSVGMIGSDHDVMICHDDPHHNSSSSSSSSSPLSHTVTIIIQRLDANSQSLHRQRHRQRRVSIPKSGNAPVRLDRRGSPQCHNICWSSTHQTPWHSRYSRCELDIHITWNASPSQKSMFNRATSPALSYHRVMRMPEAATEMSAGSKDFRNSLWKIRPKRWVGLKTVNAKIEKSVGSWNLCTRDLNAISHVSRQVIGFRKANWFGNVRNVRKPKTRYVPTAATSLRHWHWLVVFPPLY